MKVIEVINGNTIKVDNNWSFTLKGIRYTGNLINVIIKGYEKQYDNEIKDKLIILLLNRRIYLKNITKNINHSVHTDRNSVEGTVYLRYRDVSYYFPELSDKIKKKYPTNLYTATEKNIFQLLQFHINSITKKIKNFLNYEKHIRNN